MDVNSSNPKQLQVWWRHGLPIVFGLIFVGLAILAAAVYPIAIADELAVKTPEELEWLKFGEWRATVETDATWFDPSVEIRDSQPFARLIYDVQVRQYKIDAGGGHFAYRNAIQISRNTLRTTIAGLLVASIWIVGSSGWAKLLPRWSSR